MMTSSKQHVAGWWPVTGSATIPLAAAVLATLRTLMRRHHERRALQALPDAALDDIGLTRGDVDRVALEPFWQPIDYAALTRQRRLNARRQPRGVFRR